MYGTPPMISVFNVILFSCRVPDTWVAEDEISHHTEKTIPVSQLPPEALQPPVMDALGLSGILSRPGKRKRK